MILSDSGSTTVHTYLKRLSDWKWLEGGLETEVPATFTRTGPSWVSPKIGLKVEAPSPDSTLLDSFHQHMLDGGRNGETWNRKLGLPGMVLPMIEGIHAQLVYYYPVGLYFNYTISDTYFFPEAGFLFIFTNQQIRADGNDTMHGFLIFKTKR